MGGGSNTTKTGRTNLNHIGVSRRLNIFIVFSKLSNNLGGGTSATKAGGKGFKPILSMEHNLVVLKLYIATVVISLRVKRMASSAA